MYQLPGEKRETRSFPPKSRAFGEKKIKKSLLFLDRKEKRGTKGDTVARGKEGGRERRALL